MQEVCLVVRQTAPMQNLTEDDAQDEVVDLE